VFSGAALAHAGVTAPTVHPDEVVLLRADAFDDVDVGRRSALGGAEGQAGNELLL
jgi:hypothetical protein